MTPWIYILMAGAVGYAAWGASTLALGLAPVMVYLWAQAPNRLYAGLTAWAYYLAVARGMPQGTAIFFGTDASILVGTGFWLLTAALLALPWMLLWSKRPAGYWWRLTVVLIAVSLPPLGVFGWGNPLTAAGALLPGTAWAGLIMVLALMLAYCYARSKHHALILHGVLAVALLYSSLNDDPVSEIHGIDTRLSGVGLGQYDYLQSYQNNRSLIRSATDETEPILLFPESVAGLWHSTTADLWVSQNLQKTIFLGAAEPHPGGNYSNVIVALTPNNQHIMYRQRIPVPVGMWNPFQLDSAIAHWTGQGSFQLGQTRYGALLCYEQLLIWPVIQTYAEQPDIVLAPTNAWWSRDTAVPAVQKSIVTAWARLFNVPTVTAFNY